MTEGMAVLRGSCLCQGVAFEIDGAVTGLLYCHCAMCRKAHGSAFRARGEVRASGFRWTRGEALVRYFESSPGTHRGFCSVCGSNLLSRFDRNPDVLGLALGVLDDDPVNRPVCHVFVGAKAPWHEITDALPRFQEGPPEWPLPGPGTQPGTQPEAERSRSVLEVAPLCVKAGQELAFEAAFAQAQRIIASMPGYLSHDLQRCVERPGEYLLLVAWRTLEDHEEGFRRSDAYQQWKRLLHHFYDPFPVVSHYRAVRGASSAPDGGRVRDAST